jgi:hypothetical protein
MKQILDKFNLNHFVEYLKEFFSKETGKDNSKKKKIKFIILKAII